MEKGVWKGSGNAIIRSVAGGCGGCGQAQPIGRIALGLTESGFSTGLSKQRGGRGGCTWTGSLHWAELLVENNLYARNASGTDRRDGWWRILNGAREPTPR